jgi:hypothetical protein
MVFFFVVVFFCFFWGLSSMELDFKFFLFTANATVVEMMMVVYSKQPFPFLLLGLFIFS